MTRDQRAMDPSFSSGDGDSRSTGVAEPLSEAFHHHFDTPNTEMVNIMHENHCRTDHLAENSDPVGPVIFGTNSAPTQCLASGDSVGPTYVIDKMMQS